MHFRIVQSGQFAVFTIEHADVYAEMWDSFFLRYNHTFENIVVESDLNPKQINGTWTGTMALFQRGLADMEMNFAAYDEEAGKIVDYIWLQCQMELSILHREMISTRVPDVMEPLMASDPQVWFIALTALVVVSSLTYMANKLLVPLTHENYQDNNLLTFFLILLYAGSPRWPRHFCNQILLTFYLFYVMVFICSVYATMKESASFIVPRVYKTVRDVVDDDKAPWKCLDTNELIASVFQSSSRPHYQKFWNRIEATPGSLMLANIDLVKEGERVIHSLEKEDLRVVSEPELSSFLLSLICQQSMERNMMLMYFIERVNNGRFYAYRLLKNVQAEKRRHLFQAVSRLMQSGIFDLFMDSLKGKYEVRCTSSTVNVIENPMDSLQLACLSNALKLWFSGLIVATLCYIIELSVACIKRAGKGWQKDEYLHVLPRDHPHRASVIARPKGPRTHGTQLDKDTASRSCIHCHTLCTFSTHGDDVDTQE